MTTNFTFGGRALLAALGRSPDERLSLNVQPAGGQFRSLVTTVAQFPDGVADCNVWFGAAVLHPRVTTGRGSEKDIVGIRALFVDLDVKDGGMPSEEAARAVIVDLTALLEVAPVAVVVTGGGLQPHWRLERSAGTDWPDEHDPRWLAAVTLYRRWGRLAAKVAALHGGKVDSVFDLSRVLRVPGTFNAKYNPPRPVTMEPGPDGTVSLDHLNNVLNHADIPVTDEDRATGGPISSPAEWAFAERTCPYTAAMIEGWETDEPNPGRHQWLTDRAVRLACAHRLGCLSAEDHERARELLRDRLLSWREENPPGEVGSTFDWGQQQAAAKTDAAVHAELSGHSHDGGSARETAAWAKLGVDVDQLTARYAAAPGAVNGGDAAWIWSPLPVTELTEAGLSDVLSHRLEYLGWAITDTNEWLRRTEDRWRLTTTTESANAISRLLDCRLLDAHDPDSTHEPDNDAAKDREKALAQLRRTARTNAGQNAIIALTGRRHHMRVIMGELDREPELWAGGYAWDLGTTQPASGVQHATYVHQHSAAVVPDSRGLAVAPAFAGVLTGLLPDPEQQAYLQLLAGSAATVDAPPAIAFLYGLSGGEGKGTVVTLIARALGSYAHAADTRLVQSGANPHPTILADLAGKRLVYFDEPPGNDKTSREAIKALTGNTVRSAHRMRRDPFPVTPTWTVFISSNEPPLIDDGALARRYRVLTCHLSPDAVGRAAAAVQRQAEERAGVLGWILEGTQRYLADTTAVWDASRAPQSVLLATAEARFDELDEWLNSATREGRAHTTELRRAFLAATDANATVWSARRFTIALRRKGFVEPVRSDGKTWATREVTQQWQMPTLRVTQPQGQMPL